MSWEISTTPVDVPGFKPTAHLVIDSTKTDKAKLAKLEEMLYGTDGDQATEPTLPMPEKVIEMLKASRSRRLIHRQRNFLSGALFTEGSAFFNF